MATLDEKRKQYEAKLLILKEKRKMHMMTQDEYDRQQQLVSEEVFGPRKKEEK